MVSDWVPHAQRTVDGWVGVLPSMCHRELASTVSECALLFNPLLVEGRLPSSALAASAASSGGSGGSGPTTAATATVDAGPSTATTVASSARKEVSSSSNVETDGGDAMSLSDVLLNDLDPNGVATANRVGLALMNTTCGPVDGSDVCALQKQVAFLRQQVLSSMLQAAPGVMLRDVTASAANSSADAQPLQHFVYVCLVCFLTAYYLSWSDLYFDSLCAQ
jgi:hypothetical protein